MFFGIQGLLCRVTVVATGRRICNLLEWDNKMLMMELLYKTESYVISKDEENIANFYERKRESSSNVL